ncbi:MAG: hypothetical protein U0Y82_05995 [Thermoleophilia bacterium]
MIHTGDPRDERDREAAPTPRPDREAEPDDGVDEASEESFPSSDPPSHGGPGMRGGA